MLHLLAPRYLLCEYVMSLQFMHRDLSSGCEMPLPIERIPLWSRHVSTVILAPSKKTLQTPWL